MRLSLLSFVVAVAVAACNAYATPAVVVHNRRHWGKRNMNSSRRSLTKRSVSSNVYDLKRYFPFDKSSNSATASQSPLTEEDTAAFSTNKIIAPSKRVSRNLLLSCALALTLVASLSSRQALSSYSASLLEQYKGAMVRFPLKTKVATGATLAVLGDALAQTREPQQKGYDPRRAASFAAFDSCYRFFQHNAFPFIISICQGKVLGGLLSAIPGVSVGSTNLKLGLAALERTLVYQLLVIPLLYYPIFFSFTGYLQGLKPDEIVQRAKTSFLPCWKKNLMFWIPTQMVMFGLIDEKWQIPFACVMGMLWSTILSVTAGNANKKAS